MMVKMPLSGNRNRLFFELYFSFLSFYLIFSRQKCGLDFGGPVLKFEVLKAWISISFLFGEEEEDNDYIDAHIL